MKSWRVLIACALLLCFAAGVQALDVPPVNGYVNDHANMISTYTEQEIERKLAELDRTDSTQVAVLTISSLEGENLEDFSIRVADAWKVGQKGTDNGVILLVSKTDRKIRIEVGYGLEHVLTDVLAGRIIDFEIRPHFQNGDFDSGISAGVAGIVDAVHGEYTQTKPRVHKRNGPSLLFLLAFIIVVPLFRYILNPRFIFVVLLSKLMGHESTKNDKGWFGGFSGSGFGSGGGFGGFGGGGFGGGGASGGW